MLKLQPSELDRMDFWRAEMLVEIHKEKTEEENRKRKKQEDQQSAGMPNMNSMLAQQQNMFKGMGVNTPSLNIPKFG
jgi:hypothetical protein